MSTARRPRVAVACDQALIGDVIAAGLSAKGLHNMVVAWPRGGQAPDSRLLTGLTFDVALLVCDFERINRTRSAARMITESPLPWVILTNAPKGPLWGALLHLGSCHVAPATTCLDEVVDLLSAVADGRSIFRERDREALVDSWHARVAEHEEVMARLATMTPREAQVLNLLYAGTSVRVIAHQLDVAEATVRTQVKRLLRKLDVRSQLAAVAALEHLRQQEPSSGEDIATTAWWGSHWHELSGRRPPSPLAEVHASCP